MKEMHNFLLLFVSLKAMGLKVFTNLHYRKPEVCSMEGRLPFPRPLYLASEEFAPLYSYAPSRIACG